MLIVLNTETQSKDIVGMLNKVINVQVCDPPVGGQAATLLKVAMKMEL